MYDITYKLEDSGSYDTVADDPMIRRTGKPPPSPGRSTGSNARARMIAVTCTTRAGG